MHDRRAYEQFERATPGEQLDMTDPSLQEALAWEAENKHRRAREALQHTLLHALAWRCGARIALEQEIIGERQTEARHRLETALAVQAQPSSRELIAQGYFASWRWQDGEK